MDDAEAWLADRDPNYCSASRAWKQMRGGNYRCPRQEIPWGNGNDLALLVEGGAGDYVADAPRRACDRCGFAFVPMTPWHRFCSDACKMQAHRRRAA